MIAWLLCWALAAPVLPPGSVPPELASVAAEVRRAPLPERIVRISGVLLGRPYRRDPAGEGEAPDPDPLGRYDVFDCLTYVEEVLALALALDPAAAPEVRHALRYGRSSASHADRRHSMELQWIPGAIADGWLADTTARYGVVEPRRRAIGAADWAAWQGLARLGLDPGRMPAGTLALDVLPIGTALEVADRVAVGSVIALVRRDRADQPLWITHVGLVVEGGTLRHASPSGASQVVDIDLRAYLARAARRTDWPVDGVVVLEPIEQAPMRAPTRPPSP